MIYIKKGQHTATGGYTTEGWTVHVPGLGADTFRALSHAKRMAAEWGASGKWRRELKPTGPRGLQEVHYYDAKPEPA